LKLKHYVAVKTEANAKGIREVLQNRFWQSCFEEKDFGQPNEAIEMA
jgi:hypothetical protein